VRKENEATGMKEAAQFLNVASSIVISWKRRQRHIGDASGKGGGSFGITGCDQNRVTN
jgi:hypothetical protein